jgi:hypothetical protein
MPPLPRGLHVSAWSVFTFRLGSPVRLLRARTSDDAARVSAGTFCAIAYGASWCMGWPCLTCGRTRNRAALAQVKAKREHLTK